MAETPTPTSTEGSRINRNLFKLAAGIRAAVGTRLRPRELLKAVGQDDKVEEINGTRITYEEFKPGGKEVIDPKIATICLPGFAWSAAEQSIHIFPQALATSFGTRGFLVDTKRSRDDSASLAQQADDLRMFFEQRGIEEFNLAGQSLGALKIAYFAENLEKHGKKVNLVILANPKGLDKMGRLDLMHKFAKDVMKLGPAERIRNEKNKIKKVTNDGPPSAVQKGFFKSILRNVKDFGWQYMPLLWDQLKLLTTIDPIYSKIKAPVLMFVAQKDKVVETENYAPGQKVTPEIKNTRKEQVQTNRAALSPDLYHLVSQGFKQLNFFF